MKQKNNMRLFLLTVILTMGITHGSSAGPTVTVDSVPNVEYKVSTTFSGTLTQVAAEVAQLEQNGQGPQIGRQTLGIQWPPSVSEAPGKEEHCCVDEDTDGKKWIIESSDISVEWEFEYNDIYLPAWGDYDSVCTSAKNEWDRWRGVVKDHEDGHADVAEDFFKKSKIESYYSEAALDFESECVEPSEIESAKEAAINDYMNQMTAIAQTIGSDYDEAQNEYHNEAPYSTIDTSKDCS